MVPIGVILGVSFRKPCASLVSSSRAPLRFGAMDIAVSIKWKVLFLGCPYN